MSTSSTLGIAVGHQPERLLKQGALHAVHDEAVELLLHHQRCMAGRHEELARALHRLGCRSTGAGTTSAAGIR